MTSRPPQFTQPPSERTILRYALKSLLTAYAEDHPALPFDVDDPNLDTLTDHRTDFGGNYSQLVSRLAHRFDETSFEINSDTHLETDDLQEIIDRESASYPMVELDQEYYDLEVDDYTVQMGQYGHRLPALLLPLSIEESAVFYYDPLHHHYGRDQANMRSMSEGLFDELWSRGDLTRWALWVDQGQQRTLMDINEAES